MQACQLYIYYVRVDSACRLSKADSDIFPELVFSQRMLFDLVVMFRGYSSVEMRKNRFFFYIFKAQNFKNVF